MLGTKYATLVVFFLLEADCVVRFSKMVLR